MVRIFRGIAVWTLATLMLAAGLATAGLASDRAALIAQIELAGQNEYENRRHAVEIDACQLTTYRWKKIDGEGWVLWTSFEFPMLKVEIMSSLQSDGTKHYFSLDGDPPTAIIIFKGKDGFELSHEKPRRRKAELPNVSSPRGDGTTHYIEKKNQGVIVQTGPDVIEKAEQFTAGYIRYVQEYCTFIG